MLVFGICCFHSWLIQKTWLYVCRCVFFVFLVVYFWYFWHVWPGLRLKIAACLFSACVVFILGYTKTCIFIAVCLYFGCIFCYLWHFWPGLRLEIACLLSAGVVFILGSLQKHVFVGVFCIFGCTRLVFLSLMLGPLSTRCPKVQNAQYIENHGEEKNSHRRSEADRPQKCCSEI